MFQSRKLVMEAPKKIGLCTVVKFPNLQNTYCLPPHGIMLLMAPASTSTWKEVAFSHSIKPDGMNTNVNKYDALAGKTPMSENQNKHSSIFNLDTLRLRKRLESRGLPPKVAEAVATSMKEIINSCLETASASFASQAEREKANLVFEAKFLQLKEELLKSQRPKIMANLHEVDKIISFGVEKIRSELRHDLSKEVASMRVLISTTKPSYQAATRELQRIYGADEVAIAS